MQAQILGLVTPLMALFFAATFVALWRTGKVGKYVLGFAVAYVFFPLGFLATHFLPPDGIYVFHITQLLYTIATTALMASICARAGQRLHLPLVVYVYLVGAFALAVVTSLSNDVGPRLLIVNMGYGVITMMGLTVLLNSNRREAIDVAIIALMALGAADFFVRPVLSLLIERTIPAEVYRESIYYSLIGLFLGVKAVTGALLLIIATIGDLMAAQREISERDLLTGLRNRGAFEEAISKLLPKAHVEDRQLSLVVADIDNFKQVNDIWGHQAGDQAIACFGQLILNNVRECDIAGRIGGEEFCIAIWNCGNGSAETLAERLRQTFAHTQHSGISDDIRLTASFGVATAKAGEDYKDLFARADTALYQAKSNGRNCVVKDDWGRSAAELPIADLEEMDWNRAAAAG